MKAKVPKLLRKRNVDLLRKPCVTVILLIDAYIYGTPLFSVLSENCFERDTVLDASQDMSGTYNA